MNALFETSENPMPLFGFGAPAYMFVRKGLRVDLMRERFLWEIRVEFWDSFKDETMTYYYGHEKQEITIGQFFNQIGFGGYKDRSNFTFPMTCTERRVSEIQMTTMIICIMYRIYREILDSDEAKKAYKVELRKIKLEDITKDM